MFAFMCFSSCASGPSRRPVEVIFTLEKDGQTLGRRVVEIRVCVCPGRDRKSDERAACGEPSSFQAARMHQWKGGNTGPGAKRRRTSSRNSIDEEFVIPFRNRHVYELLLDFKEKLEVKFESLDIDTLVLRTSEDEGEQPLTSGRDEVKGVINSSSELPTSSSPQPSYSIPPAHPYNIGHTSCSPSIAFGNRNATISSITTSHSENVSRYSEASTAGPFMSPPNMSGVVSRLPTFPSTIEYPGDIGFQISFGLLTESASKSATWTYSDVCKKLYVNLASFCPIKFKTNMPPPHGTILRAVAIFKGSTNLYDVVKRCPNHMESSNDGSAPEDQFIRSNNPAAVYHTCPVTMRDSVVLPYDGPQVGTEYVTEMFAFMCFSSCASGPSRRPVEVIFTLEKDGQTLGRRVVEIRVCVCPGRDRKSDERAACRESSSFQAVRMHPWKGSGNTGSGAKRRRTSSRNSTDEEFVIPFRNRHMYELLLDFKEKLEDMFESLDIDTLVLRTSEDEGEQPLTSGRDEVKGVITSSSELSTSSNPQPSYSIPPAHPYNIGHTSCSPSIAFGNRNATISSITTSHSENVSSYSEASTAGPFMSPPNMSGVVSRLPTFPSTIEYPGDIGFQISFGLLTESASKSATWTYSDVCKKLYVNLASFCPIKFKTNMPPPHGTILRAVAVFKGSTNLYDVVKRCPNHMENSNDGSAPEDQFIRSNNPAAVYHTCPVTMRDSVVLPYNGPQVGTEYVTEMFAFMCFSSCASGPSRRPVEVIFTLEKDGQTLGRRVVEIRVCVCPGRDRKSDERAACREPSSFQAARMHPCKGSGNTGSGAKRRRTSSRNSIDEEFVIPVS
ncbi:hypothetical protein ABFA07_016611 [Porites harrisoni]